MTEPVPFAVPDVGEAEVAAAAGVIRSRWLTTGHVAREFEQAFAEWVDARYAVALNSCTAALHLSLEAFGVSDGDCVYLSPYTFAASAEVVRYVGARPVFVDVQSETLNIDVEALRREIERDLRDGRRGTPAAIMPVHIAGVPCDMTPIWDLAAEFELAVVEDAAHAFPAAHDARPTGQVPPNVRGAVCFSFYATKTITTGEGGMVTTEDAQVADRIRTMSLHGLSRQAWSRYSAGGSWVYDIVAPGYKYNITDIAAAIGCVQLERADEMRRRRSEIAAAYGAEFAVSEFLQTPTVPAGRLSAWHLYILRVQPGGISRDRLIEELGERGIGTSVHFIPLHLHSYYQANYGYEPNDFPNALREYQRALSLPIYSAMSDVEIERVIRAVMEIVDD